MTTFIERPGSAHQYLMDTIMPLPVKAGLQTISAVEGVNPVQGIRRLLSVHKYVADCRIAGGLVISQLDGRLDPVDLPPIVPHQKKELNVYVQASVSDHAKQYLERYTNPEDPMDLFGFWRSAYGLYSTVRERKALGANFAELPGDLHSIIEVEFDELFQ